MDDFEVEDPKYIDTSFGMEAQLGYGNLRKYDLEVEDPQYTDISFGMEASPIITDPVTNVLAALIANGFYFVDDLASLLAVRASVRSAQGVRFVVCIFRCAGQTALG